MAPFQNAGSFIYSLGLFFRNSKKPSPPQASKNDDLYFQTQKRRTILCFCFRAQPNKITLFCKDAVKPGAGRELRQRQPQVGMQAVAHTPHQLFFDVDKIVSFPHWGHVAEAFCKFPQAVAWAIHFRHQEQVPVCYGLPSDMRGKCLWRPAAAAQGRNPKDQAAANQLQTRIVYKGDQLHRDSFVWD